MGVQTLLDRPIKATVVSIKEILPNATMMTDQGEEPQQLPALKYGYRTEPLDWPELIQIITVEGNPEKLTRSVEQQRTYMQYTRTIQSQWRSMLDYILCTKFGLEQRTLKRRQDQDDATEEGGNLWFAYPPLSELAGIHSRTLKNDFPYHLVDHVEHWILWKIGGPCLEADMEAAKNDIRNQLGNVQDFLHWINPPHVKSIPEIEHVHFLVLRAEKSKEVNSKVMVAK